MIERNCPCGSCVTCACTAVPKVDEDGLCLSCGGQPYALATRVLGDVPHVGCEVEDVDERRRIEKIVWEGEVEFRNQVTKVCDLARVAVRQNGVPADLHNAIEALPLYPE